MAQRTLRDLFLDQLQDMYSAENQLTKALPKMAKAANNPELKRGFEQHLKQTEQHYARLEKVFQAVGEKAKLTEEQQGKMRDVFTKFRESGKDRAEMQAFIAEELKLTDAQKKGREEQTALFAEITKEVEAVLTAEQKTKLAELRTQRGGRPGAPGAAPGKRPERKKND